MMKMTVAEVLKVAIEKETEAQCFYRDLAERSENKATKTALEALALWEQCHKEQLEQYQRGELGEGTLKPGEVVDYKIAEKLEQPQITPEMPLKDVFILAAEREMASHDFYMAFAAMHREGKIKILLEELAVQEISHKHRVEFLYTETAFPQTDGG